jgi:hypothetical protein
MCALFREKREKMEAQKPVARLPYPCYGCRSVVRFIRTYPDGTFLI